MSDSCDLFDPFDGSYFLDECFEFGSVFDVDVEVSAEESVVAVDVDASHHDFLFFGDDASDVVDDSNVVVSDNLECDGVLRVAFSAPFCPYDAVAESFAHLGCVGAVGAVYFDSSVDGDESEDAVAVDGVAAFGELEVNALEVFVYDDDVVVGVGDFLVWVLEDEVLCALCCLR